MAKFRDWLNGRTAVTIADADELYVRDDDTDTSKKIAWSSVKTALSAVFPTSATLTTDGDILTRAAGVPARITRADLATDLADETAFASQYAALSAWQANAAASKLVAWDTFERATLGTTAESGQTYTTFGAGTASITGNALVGAGVAGVVLPCGYNDYLLAATFLATGTASTSYGGIVARWIDTSNYVMVATTAQSPTLLRIVKRVAGTETTLAELTLSPELVALKFYRSSVRVVGATIYAELDAGGGLRYAVSHTLTGGDETTFATSDYVGLRANTQARLSDFSVNRLGTS